MGNTTYQRKATFTVEKLRSGERLFHPVNKRAHTVARKLGKRSNLTVQQLKSAVGRGTYKFYYYDAQGALKAVRF